jgi:hypothetical protein
MLFSDRPVPEKFPLHIQGVAQMSTLKSMARFVKVRPPSSAITGQQLPGNDGHT